MINTTKPVLRMFTDADWQAYQGCETDEPLIGRAEIGGSRRIEVVVDGFNVNVNYHEGGLPIQIYNRNFSEAEAAIYVATMILVCASGGLPDSNKAPIPPFKPEILEELGFENVGEL